MCILDLVEQSLGVPDHRLPDHRPIIDHKQSSLEERFAEIGINQVRLKLRKEAEHLAKYPKGMKKIFQMPNMPAKLKLGNKCGKAA